MEIWNTAYCKELIYSEKAKKTSERYTEAKKNTINAIYKFYVETIKNTSFSLNQAQWISYIEEYCVHEFCTVILKFKEYDYDIDKTIKHLNTYSSEQNIKYPGIDTHRENFKNKINDLLSSIFGKNIDLSIFQSQENLSDSGYEIDEEDLTYLLFLYAIYDTEDAQNFICANYRCVSDRFFEWILLGAETLVAKKRIPNISVNDLNNRFEIKFGLKQRQVDRKFEELASEFQIIVCLVEEFAKASLNSETAEQRCTQCVEILESCQKNLFKFRSQLMDDDKIDKKTIDEIIRRQKASLEKEKTTT